MTVAIWKFTLPLLVDYVHIDMPNYAHVLSTAFQGDALRVWASVVPKNLIHKRKFFVAPTGWPCGNGASGEFIGTAFNPQGLVFHVFDHGYDQ